MEQSLIHRCLTIMAALPIALAISSTASVADEVEKFEGEYEFTTYCATCHGLDGKGGGPVAEVLKTPPSNLTSLAKENNGVFPYERVFAMIEGREVAVVHGREMPLWGERYSSEVKKPIVRARILELVTYIKDIQQ